MALSIHGRGGPEQAETAHLTDAEAFARRIGASSARIIIVLEKHLTEIMDELANGPRRDILRQAGISLYLSEATDEAEYKKYPVKYRIKAMNQHEERVRDLLRRNTADFSYHSIGAHLVSFEEAIAQFRKEKGTNNLVDAFMLGLARKMLDLKPGDKMPEPFVFIFAFAVWESCRKNPENILLHPDNKHKLKIAQSSRISLTSLAARLFEEWEAFDVIYSNQRLIGKADEISVRNILGHLKPEQRAVIVHGWNHGLMANNPASLPDQLAIQLRAAGHTDISQELLMPMTKKSAGEIYQVLQRAMKLSCLRESVIVYDHELRREWPVLEWCKEAPQLYGWKSGRDSAPISPRT